MIRGIDEQAVVWIWRNKPSARLGRSRPNKAGVPQASPAVFMAGTGRRGNQHHGLVSRDDPSWVGAAMLSGLGRALSRRDEVRQERGVCGYPERRCQLSHGSSRHDGHERALRGRLGAIEASAGDGCAGPTFLGGTNPRHGGSCLIPGHGPILETTGAMRMPKRSSPREGLECLVATTLGAATYAQTNSLRL